MNYRKKLHLLLNDHTAQTVPDLTTQHIHMPFTHKCMCACVRVVSAARSSVVLLHGPVSAPSPLPHLPAPPDVSYCPEERR